jgi:ABC-type transport system involved in multi-copper enzyme maturation permease subunit
MIAEARRFLARRAFRMIGALCIVAVIVGGVIVFLESSKSLNASLPQARQVVAECHQAIETGPTARIKHGDVTVRDVTSCPTLRDAEQMFDKRFKYADAVPATTQNIAIPLFFLALALAASFIGAEWGTGMMTTTLTWEPRRGRVLLAKTIPALVILGLAVAVVLAFMAVAYIPIGVFRGTTAGMTAGFWQHLSGLWLRAALVAVFGAAIGMGLATLARNTVAALGIGFVYIGVVDPILRLLWNRRFAPWFLTYNLASAMHMPVEGPVKHGVFGTSVSERLVPATHPAILLTIYAAGLLAAAYLAFRTRDVT